MLAGILAGTSCEKKNNEGQHEVSRLTIRRDGNFPELYNLLHLTDDFFSGAEPTGYEAFDELAQLGVKTIVSVDGARL